MKIKLACRDFLEQHADIEQTIEQYGYDPRDMPTDCKQPVILVCRVCGKAYKIQISGIRTATARCSQCRIRIKPRKKGGWHDTPCEPRKYEFSDNRRCWRCGEYLDYGQDRYCAEHQAQRDRAVRRRQEWVIAV